MSGYANVSVRMFNFKRAATEQGGLLTGKDPTAVNLADPLRLWIIQVGIIVLMTQILALGLRRIRQPKVIAEVLGGIILGPTAFGRIPGFTEHIFPQDSRPFLSLVANIGLCLFLFLIGLEIDGAVIKRNARLSATIGLAGMALPFGLGAALAVPLYSRFIDPAVKFTHFMLFTGVAYSITAFPVLCRILTELKLLDTTVGIVVLSAGVANDIIGWTLLALAIGLVNGGGGLTALYILLTCLAWTVFLLVVVRRALHWLARKTGSIEGGPTVFFMTMVILTVFGSAFFTDVIGVHAIFGAFLAGIIVPRDGGLAIALTEKLEDMVSIIFLPLYFTISGLSTDLGLLDNGITWGFTIAICVLAYTGKFGGCTLAARYFAGFNWREASTIGSLMSCKGLIELIVLNVGLSANILSTRVFSMFVLEALLLTFMTTPAVVALYPPQYRTRAAAAGANFANVAGPRGDQDDAEGTDKVSEVVDGDGWKQRFTVVLDKTEHLSGMMALTQLIQPPTYAALEDSDSAKNAMHSVSVDALRLIELTDHAFSGVMKSSVAESLLQTDPLLGIFRTFGELHDLPISTALSVVRYDDLAGSVAEHAHANGSQLIILPWLPPAVPAPADVGDLPTTGSYNPFDSFFRPTPAGDARPSAVHAQFVRGVFMRAPCDVALFIDRGRALGAPRTAGGRHHLLLPFFGGPDDRLALDFVVQLCADCKVSATVMRVVKLDHAPEGTDGKQMHVGDNPSRGQTIHSTVGFPDTVYGQPNTQTRLQSETADSVAWGHYADAPREPRSGKLAAALSRVQFVEVASPTPLHAVLQRAAEPAHKGTRLLIVTGRSRRLAVESHAAELQQLMEEHGSAAAAGEVRKTVGDVATAFIAARSHAGLVVVQANVATA